MEFLSASSVGKSTLRSRILSQTLESITEEFPIDPVAFQEHIQNAFLAIFRVPIFGTSDYAQFSKFINRTNDDPFHSSILGSEPIMLPSSQLHLVAVDNIHLTTSTSSQQPLVGESSQIPGAFQGIDWFLSTASVREVFFKDITIYGASKKVPSLSEDQETIPLWMTFGWKLLTEEASLKLLAAIRQ